MNYKTIAQRCLRLFREYVGRRGRPRRFGANVGPGFDGTFDRSSFRNPNNNRKSERGMKPGRGRDRRNPVRSVRTTVASVPSVRTTR
jgi:hypothetical protein